VASRLRTDDIRMSRGRGRGVAVAVVDDDDDRDPLGPPSPIVATTSSSPSDEAISAPKIDIIDLFSVTRRYLPMIADAAGGPPARASSRRPSTAESTSRRRHREVDRMATNSSESVFSGRPLFTLITFPIFVTTFDARNVRELFS